MPVMHAAQSLFSLRLLARFSGLGLRLRAFHLLLSWSARFSPHHRPGPGCRPAPEFVFPSSSLRFVPVAQPSRPSFAVPLCRCAALLPLSCRFHRCARSRLL